MGSNTPSPVFLTVTQVQGEVGRFTEVEPVVNMLKRFNVRMIVEHPKIINFLSSFAGNFDSIDNCIIQFPNHSGMDGCIFGICYFQAT